MRLINSMLCVLFLHTAFSQDDCSSIEDDFTGTCTSSTYADGVTKSTTQYVNGVKHGEYTEYYHHGEIGAQGTFAEGHFIGTYTRFSPSGSIILSAEIDENGSGEMTEFNFKGTVLTKGVFQNWKKSGTWTDYNYKGDVLNEIEFDHSTSKSASYALIEEYGFGEEPTGVVDFPTFETYFVGGPAAMQSYIARNVKYPSKAIKNGISGKVYVSFIVNEDGSISDAKVVRGVHPTLDTEALRVINSMPAWDPAVEGGIRVKARARLPINFTLSKKR